jgi:hypothetical protein
LLLGVAILVIYLVLGILYESFIHPLTILSGIPAAGLGALLTLLIFGRELDIYAFVGLIMLVGLVKKNAIMMVDFAISCATRRQLSSRLNLSSVHRSLPANHDDDAGSIDGNIANRIGFRCGSVSAPGPRTGRRRRSNCFANAYALHHAGCVSLL